MPTTPRAAPVALRGTMSIAISPPRKHINTPMAMPKRSMARILINQLFPPKRNRYKEMASSMPATSAGYLRSPWNSTSLIHPESTVPTTPQMALIEMIVDASTVENPLIFSRNRIPQLLMAYRLIYMKALARARIHTPGFLRTARWMRDVSFLAASMASGLCCLAAFWASSSSWVISPESTSMGARPLLSGVSCSQNNTRTTPKAPATAAPKNPHCHPNAETNRPTNRKERNSPKLWLAEKKP